MILRYETLALQPEETLQTICDFIGEPYSPDMLTMEGAPTFLDKGGNRLLWLAQAWRDLA